MIVIWIHVPVYRGMQKSQSHMHKLRGKRDIGNVIYKINVTPKDESLINLFVEKEYALLRSLKRG